ncbi:hypothetical protein MIV055R [Invertebrate iridescent virus 3]|uniref:Putative transcription elongation factor S-II-like protein 055R n=1 Tax=Invertebrate iridescent virus 3 TaxID=345201 RepID=VF349_IIV3|nr:hypothetical protein MIV055R [Invertebrate iridescent virus 3]Q197A5.1 RecName: Full=Putative transcription elongation factor S-II-like protein 055R [Invertebrate iridescent virus 3]ABF82085.1 hypothetical protein MIV055R [Invertebrate iridescent virus 3]
MDQTNLRRCLATYFGDEKNINHILKKTAGPDQMVQIYQILTTIENPSHSEQDNFRRAVTMVKQNQLGWGHPIFQPEQQKISEENDFITCPYEVSEGVLRCGKCDCTKILWFSKQTRSMDEPTTIFASCSNCKTRWTE